MTREGKTNKEIFSVIFRTNHWGSKESASGPGAEIRQTEEIRKELPKIFKKYCIKTLMDIPCGDFNWMKTVDFTNINNYIGADIVPELIELNRAKFSDQKKEFIELDITKDLLPKVDLIFSRDCFVHLKNKDICDALNNIKKSGSSFFLATTYIFENKNFDTNKGKWRPINLNLKPFNLPPHIKYIGTDFRNGVKNHPGNGMALWRISDLAISKYFPI